MKLPLSSTKSCTIANSASAFSIPSGGRWRNTKSKKPEPPFSSTCGGSSDFRLTLKGKNRIDFEKQLKRDIERHLKKSGADYRAVSLMRGRIYVHGLSTLTDLRSVLGVYSFSPAWEIPRDYGELKATLRGLMPDFRGFRSFRISCQRVDKTFSPDSMIVEREIGDIVGRETGTPVNLTDPELNIQIEIGSNHIYLFTEKQRGFSGFPFGSAGKLVSLISGGIDSPVATFLMMKHDPQGPGDPGKTGGVRRR